MKLWGLYCFNVWVDIKRSGRKIKKAWKQLKQNYYGKFIKGLNKRMERMEKRSLRIYSKFYKNGGEYISAKINGGFTSRPDITISSGLVKL